MLCWKLKKPTQLIEKKQDKDKEAVNCFPVVLKEAGLVIVKELFNFKTNWTNSSIKLRDTFHI